MSMQSARSNSSQNFRRPPTHESPTLRRRSFHEDKNRNPGEFSWTLEAVPRELAEETSTLRYSNAGLCEDLSGVGVGHGRDVTQGVDCIFVAPVAERGGE